MREYLVFRALDREVDWFILRGGQYELLKPDDRGVSKSSSFPGLWLGVSAFVRGDIASVLAILQEGLESSEHGDFVQRLNRPRE